MNYINRLFQDFIGLLYPRLCCACFQTLYIGEQLICTTCLFDIPYTDDYLNHNNRVAKQLWGRIQFDSAMALLNFRKGTRVQNLLHQLKYNNQPELGLKLGNMLAERILLSTNYKEIDLIIPVPMHRKKLRKRGYNQSLCIAEGIADILSIPIDSTTLVKTKATKTQTAKNRHLRHDTLKDVFKVTDEKTLKGKHILLVDDVITTGATIEACALELNARNLSKLSIVAVAFAE
ncbi:MAG: ComF family protein [Pedobacter sp.]|nr:MAG: ComF family protein [Pedobacter sp.]